MKLLRCHIENFGVLCGYDCEFEENLTIICRENGFGKSTLAAFLKAMFYGLPRTGARKAAENERKRYEPWQGGKYGGFLEFSNGGVSYRVTRYFGKTAAKDTFDLFDLTNRTDKTPFSEKLGEELFGLDAESFSRSTFMPQLSMKDMEATSSIRAKLTNLVDDTNDMNNFDTAMASLRAYRSNLKAYRGASGEIDRLAQAYHTLEEQRYQAEKKRPELETVQRSIDAQTSAQMEKTQEIAALRERIQKAAGQRERQLKSRQLSDLRAQANRQTETLHTLREKYPSGLPTAEDIQTRREEVISLRQLEKRRQTLTLPEADRQTIEAGRSAFSDREAVLDDLKQLDAGQQKCSMLLPETRAELSEKETQQLKILSSIFQTKVPEDAEISEKQRDCRRIAELRAVRDAKMAEKAAQKKPGSGVKTALLIMGALFVLAGIGCVLAAKSTFGIAAAILGAASLLAAILGKNPERAGAEPDEEARQIEQLQTGVSEFLLQFYPDASRPDEQLIQLMLDKEAYLRLREKGSGIQKARQEAQTQIDHLTAELRLILTRYPLPVSQSLTQQTQALRDALAQYDRAQERAQQLETDRQSLSQQMQALEKELTVFFAKYRLSGEPAEQLLNRLENDLRVFETAKTASEEAQTRLTAFQRENKDASEALLQEPTLDMAALQAQETQAQRELDAQEAALRQLRQQRDTLRRAVDGIADMDDELTALDDTRKTLQKQCELADLTMDYLTRAKDTLANSYVGSVEQGFVHYANALLGEKIGRVMLDRELHLFIDEQGAARDPASFSAGTIDGVMLCMRLALVDALFQKEQPFLLLDDPFVNLDDEGTSRALSLLRSLARERQIIYLTCNTSRT